MRNFNELSKNFEEELVEVPREKLNKLLSWLYDNQMLSFEGKRFEAYYHKVSNNRVKK